MDRMLELPPLTIVLLQVTDATCPPLKHFPQAVSVKIVYEGGEVSSYAAR